MGRIHEIETPEEYYKQKIAVCSRDVSSCVLDLQQSQRCLERFNGGTERFWKERVAMDYKKLRRSRESLTMLKVRLTQVIIGDGNIVEPKIWKNVRN